MEKKRKCTAKTTLNYSSVKCHHFQEHSCIAEGDHTMVDPLGFASNGGEPGAVSGCTPSFLKRRAVYAGSSVNSQTEIKECWFAGSENAQRAINHIAK
jgi:hypothetical protein